jgi:hypothetical protein
MNDTERLINSIGLLLTQTRFARRALEDIERETANYGTFAFTSVIAAGPRFGAPPLFDGALKVHVVNINDLAPGGGFGALIEGLLGGAGRFVGNLFGGMVGGAISTPILLLHSLPKIDSIAARIARILELLGAGQPAAAKAAPGAVGRSNLTTMLESIKHAVDGLTGLFLASGGRPAQAAQTSNLAGTLQGARWRALLDSTTPMLAALGRVADGLVIALPIAIGSIAWLIARLGALRLAIAETLQFVLRNALILRGTLLVTIFDTLALVARVAARTIELLATTLSEMLSAVFGAVRESLLAVLALGATVGDAIKTTIDGLLDWLIPTIDTVLRNLGNTRAFRVITHLVRILPAILPPIFELVKDRPLDADPQRPTLRNALTSAAALPFLDVVPSPTPAAALGTPGGPSRPAFPNAPDYVSILTESLNRLEQVASAVVRTVGQQGRDVSTTLASQLNQATRAELQSSDSRLAASLDEVYTRSATLAGSLVVPERLEPKTGLEAIATAYEQWLSGGDGLQTLLGTITRHFRSDEGRGGIPQRIVEGSLDRPRAVIQIDEVVIELEPVSSGIPAPGHEATPDWGPGDFPLPPEGDDIERYARMLRDYRMRGGTMDLLPALA